MAEWRERRIPLRDTTLAVRERPGHGPVVVFEAGLGLPGSSWQPVCDRLPRDQAVLCYDRAGLGTSDPGPAPRTATRPLAELRELLAALELAPPYLLVGHSAGAFVVRMFALAHPAEVAGMVLVDPAHEDERATPWVDTSVSVALKVTAAVAGTGALAAGWRAARSAPVLRRATRGDRADLFGAALSPGHLRGTLAEDRAYAATVAEMRRAAHGRTLPDVPLRVISAEKTTGLRKLHRALAATGPQGVQVIAPGSGHLVMLDAPELVAAQIGELIRRGGTP